MNTGEIKESNYKNTDYNLVIEFLGDLYQADPEHPYWLPGRWEYAAYLVSPLHLRRGKPDWKKYIRIWRDGNTIVGIIHSESPNENVFIHLHPEYGYIKEEMIEWAENNILFNKKIKIWLRKGDLATEKLLLDRGYSITTPCDYLNWCSLADYISEVKISDEYTIQSLDDDTYLDSKIECAAKAFNSEKVTKEIYAFMQRAPSYQRSLDLFILYKKKVVSLCIVWLDQRNSLGYIEPVATHPDFQRKGLGKAILNYSMQQLQERGIARAYVGAYGDERKSFYYKSGFSDSVTFQPWERKA